MILSFEHTSPSQSKQGTALVSRPDLKSDNSNDHCPVKRRAIRDCDTPNELFVNVWRAVSGS